MADGLVYGMDAEEWAEAHALAFYQMWRWNALRYPDRADKTKQGVIDEVEYDYGIKYGMIDFVYTALKRGDTATSKYARLDGICSDARGRCYYNALDYVVRNTEEARERGITLAIGYVVEPRQKEELDDLRSVSADDRTPSSLAFATKHAFIVTGDGRVYDPTLGEALRGECYVWERVPLRQAQQFAHDIGDSNHDAKDVVSYFDDRLDDYRGAARIKQRTLRIYNERGGVDGIREAARYGNNTLRERRVRALVRRVVMDEARRKKVVRNGKRTKKLDCRDGYKAKGGKCVKMSSKERRNRSRAAKRSSRKKSSGTKKKAARKAKRSKRKR